MRALASALILIAVTASSAQASKIAYRDGKQVVVVYSGSAIRQPIDAPNNGPPRWSGDGRLLSIGGTVVGRVALPAADLAWAPTGETAAFTTKRGALMMWSPTAGTRLVLPAAWGVTSLAWGAGRTLALGRSVCHAPCGVPAHQEVWTWYAGVLHRVAGPLGGVQRPIVRGIDPGGRVLWWPDYEGSGSIMADGLQLYADRVPIVETLAYPDYVTNCGSHVAMAAGGDRYAMNGKRIMLDGLDLSRDRTRSWVSPSCSADGRTIVAAASRHLVPRLIGREHRAIWQLRPIRRQLTRPPSRWTDEYPRVLRDGSVMFVRTRVTATKVAGSWRETQKGKLLLWKNGGLMPVGTSSITQNEIGGPFPTNYYGHYPWPDLIAVDP